ncbi:hypothetical protein CDAR_320501 [Caerostris darwini]|uniref:Uncharacterized protein n=1 Tax=Caerostris darwini TaxID=1538125 RepID=A0AAV4WY47_9ARAC|nr:hypothetical protein CDAR_320501 [Caerostris darwini]
MRRSEISINRFHSSLIAAPVRTLHHPYLLQNLQPWLKGQQDGRSPIVPFDRSTRLHAACNGKIGSGFTCLLLCEPRITLYPLWVHHRGIKSPEKDLRSEEVASFILLLESSKAFQITDLISIFPSIDIRTFDLMFLQGFRIEICLH